MSPGPQFVFLSLRLSRKGGGVDGGRGRFSAACFGTCGHFTVYYRLLCNLISLKKCPNNNSSSSSSSLALCRSYNISM